MSEPIFFRPEGAWGGDIIPWQEGGAFWLYYLHEVRSDPKPGTPWHLVTTPDFVGFEDRGEALLAFGVPAGVEAALVLVGVGARCLDRIMPGAEGQVQEEALVRVGGDLVAEI